MRRAIILFISIGTICCAGFFAYKTISTHRGRIKGISLKKELSIGVKEGDPHRTFSYIPSMAVDSKGNVYIVDGKNYRVQKFNRNGEYLLTIGKHGKGPGEFDSPTDIAIDSKDNVFVLDKFLARVSKFDPQGKFVTSLKVDFFTRFMLIDSNDRIILSGDKNGKIFHVFDSKMNFVKSFGEMIRLSAKEAEVFRRPAGGPSIGYVDQNNVVYGSVPWRYEIMVYSLDKGLVRTIKRNFSIPPPIQIGRSLLYSYAPRSITVVGNGMVFYFFAVQDLEKEEITMDVFNKNGEFLFSQKSNGYGKFIDKEGKIYFIESTPFPRVVRYSFSLVK